MRPMSVISLLAVLIGIALGAVLGFLFARSRQAGAAALVTIPLLDQDVHDLDTLAQIAVQLYGEPATGSPPATR